MDDIRDAFARQGLCRAPTTACPVASPPGSAGAEHVLSARSRSAVTPMYVRPDVERIVL